MDKGCPVRKPIRRFIKAGGLSLIVLTGCSNSEAPDLTAAEQSFNGACYTYVGDVEDWFVEDLVGDMGTEAEVRSAIEDARLGATLCPCMLNAEQARYGDSFDQSGQPDYPVMFTFLGQQSFYQFGGVDAEPVELSASEKDDFLLFAQSHEQCTPDAAVAL